MKRMISYFLIQWKQSQNRKPLLLRGARQVGKTHTVRAFGKTFEHFIEINLESNQAARTIIEKDLDLDRIVLQLSELLQKKIYPRSTLLFFDEIQNVPQAITLLRYFYEQMPELHVIAAGSLLDFAIEQVGVPVGRVTTLYMYPLSFIEFLIALGHHVWVKSILNYSITQPLSDPLHEKLMQYLGIYLAIGGMPEAVNRWVASQSSRDVKKVHADLVYGYEQDFGKYARRHQIKYLQLLFVKAIDQLARKFMFARVGEYQKRELSPALELLEKAGLFYKVTRSAGQGIPIGAQADLEDFKILFLDVGLCQALLKLDITPWFIDPLATFVNKGELVESFVGQEILVYSDPIMKESLFYWQKESRGSNAEIDYLIQLDDKVVPVEVKAGINKRIVSMYMFLDSHPNSTYGIRFWAGQAAHDETIYSYPLYAIVRPLLENNSEIKNALFSLI
jgi:predicted AAA+ superfamily ATPase